MGKYDPRHPLTIDPLLQSTYLGGSYDDWINALTLASNGDVLVAGGTDSEDLPGGANGTQPNYGYPGDGFVARLSGDLRTLLQSTYLGGSDYDEIRTLTLASNGDVLVAGTTSSVNLPGRANAAQPNYGYPRDGFVARLSGDLRTLLQSTYLGGSSWDDIFTMTLASNGDVLVAGTTSSVNLPGGANGAQPNYGGSGEFRGDGFIARLSGDLRTLLQSTYLGGSDYDEIRTLTLASNGDVLVAGTTASEDLPGRANGAQPNYGGSGELRGDGFVARLSGDLRTLLQSTYLGGSDYDELRTLTLASNGDVLVAGTTSSVNLPGKANGTQPNYGGGYYDGFVARLSGDLRTLLQSTYLGGSEGDWIFTMTLASNGDVLVAGTTSSEDLPGRANGTQPNYGGSRDGFIARLSGDLRTLLQSTYLGGSDYDYIFTLTLASNGDVLVAGTTSSVNLPGRANGAQPNYGGSSGEDRGDGFIARLPGDLRAPAVSQCVGDCSGDGEVTIDELILGVNIALENASLQQCPTFDVDGSGFVEINELIVGVNNALQGCQTH